MSYSKKKFAKDLKIQLENGYDPKLIGSWAHKMYLNHCGRISEELEETLVDLFTLEEGPEFEIPESELRKIIEKFQNADD